MVSLSHAPTSISPFTSEKIERARDYCWRWRSSLWLVVDGLRRRRLWWASRRRRRRCWLLPLECPHSSLFYSRGEARAYRIFCCRRRQLMKSKPPPLLHLQRRRRCHRQRYQRKAAAADTPYVLRCVVGFTAVGVGFREFERHPL